jgi:hypothetical protein
MEGMAKNLLSFVKNVLIVFMLGFIPIPILKSVGYDGLLVSTFCISLMLLWTDGFLTLYAIRKGATEINPLMKYLNRKIGDKKGVVLSRIVGVIFPIVGLLESNPYFILVLIWLFSAIVCLNSLTLVRHFNVSVDVKDANSTKDT